MKRFGKIWMKSSAIKDSACGPMRTIPFSKPLVEHSHYQVDLHIPRQTRASKKGQEASNGLLISNIQSVLCWSLPYHQLISIARIPSPESLERVTDTT